jgi:hypothetical protein
MERLRPDHSLTQEQEPYLVGVAETRACLSQAGKAGATRSDWAADALGKFEKHRTTSEMHLARHPPGREMTESRKSRNFFYYTHTREVCPGPSRWGRPVDGAQ